MDKIKIHFTLERFNALYMSETFIVATTTTVAAKNMFTHAFILDDEVLVIDIVIGNNLTCMVLWCMKYGGM